MEAPLSSGKLITFIPLFTQGMGIHVIKYQCLLILLIHVISSHVYILKFIHTGFCMSGKASRRLSPSE